MPRIRFAGVVGLANRVQRELSGPLPPKITPLPVALIVDEPEEATTVLFVPETVTFRVPLPG